MKLLSILIILMIGQSYALAGNWVPKDEFKTSTTVWAQQARCEQVSSNDCFDRTGLDIRRWKIELIDSVETIVVDASGSNDADTEDAQELSDKTVRDAAIPIRDVALDSCVSDTVSGVLTLPLASACIRGLVREVKAMRGKPVSIADL